MASAPLGQLANGAVVSCTYNANNLRITSVEVTSPTPTVTHVTVVDTTTTPPTTLLDQNVSIVAGPQSFPIAGNYQLVDDGEGHVTVPWQVSLDQINR